MAQLKIGQVWKDREGNEVKILKAEYVELGWEPGQTYYMADNYMIYRDHCSSNRGKVKHILSCMTEQPYDLVELVGNW